MDVLGKIIGKRKENSSSSSAANGNKLDSKLFSGQQSNSSNQSSNLWQQQQQQQQKVQHHNERTHSSQLHLSVWDDILADIFNVPYDEISILSADQLLEAIRKYEDHAVALNQKILQIKQERDLWKKRYAKIDEERQAEKLLKDKIKEQKYQEAFFDQPSKSQQQQQQQLAHQSSQQTAADIFANFFNAPAIAASIQSAIPTPPAKPTTSTKSGINLLDDSPVLSAIPSVGSAQQTLNKNIHFDQLSQVTATSLLGIRNQFDKIFNEFLASSQVSKNNLPKLEKRVSRMTFVVLVSGLPQTADEAVLNRHFAGSGQIESIRLPLNEFGQVKGHALVEFAGDSNKELIKSKAAIPIDKCALKIHFLPPKVNSKSSQQSSSSMQQQQQQFNGVRSEFGLFGDDENNSDYFGGNDGGDPDGLECLPCEADDKGNAKDNSNNINWLLVTEEDEPPKKQSNYSQVEDTSSPDLLFSEGGVALTQNNTYSTGNQLNEISSIWKSLSASINSIIEEKDQLQAQVQQLNSSSKLQQSKANSFFEVDLLDTPKEIPQAVNNNQAQILQLQKQIEQLNEMLKSEQGQRQQIVLSNSKAQSSFEQEKQQLLKQIEASSVELRNLRKNLTDQSQKLSEMLANQKLKCDKESAEREAKAVEDAMRNIQAKSQKFIKDTQDQHSAQLNQIQERHEKSIQTLDSKHQREIESMLQQIKSQEALRTSNDSMKLSNEQLRTELESTYATRIAQYQSELVDVNTQLEQVKLEKQQIQQQLQLQKEQQIKQQQQQQQQQQQEQENNIEEEQMSSCTIQTFEFGSGKQRIEEEKQVGNELPNIEVMEIKIQLVALIEKLSNGIFEGNRIQSEEIDSKELIIKLIDVIDARSIHEQQNRDELHSNQQQQQQEIQNQELLFAQAQLNQKIEEQIKCIETLELEINSLKERNEFEKDQHTIQLEQSKSEQVSIDSEYKLTLQKQLDEMKQSYEEQIQHQLGVTKEEHESQISEQRQYITQLTNQIESLNESHMVALSQLQLKLNEAKETIDQIEAESERKSTLISGLESKLEQSTESQNEIEILKQLHSEQFEDQTKKFEELTRQFVKKDEELKSESMLVFEAEARVRILEERICEQREQLEAISASAGTSNNSTSHFEQEIEELKQVLLQKDSEKEAAMQQQSYEFESQIVQLQEYIQNQQTSMQEEIAQLKINHDSLTSTKDSQYENAWKEWLVQKEEFAGQIRNLETTIQKNEIKCVFDEELSINVQTALKVSQSKIELIEKLRGILGINVESTNSSGNNQDNRNTNMAEFKDSIELINGRREKRALNVVKKELETMYKEYVSHIFNLRDTHDVESLGLLRFEKKLNRFNEKVQDLIDYIVEQAEKEKTLTTNAH